MFSFRYIISFLFATFYVSFFSFLFFPLTTFRHVMSHLFRCLDFMSKSRLGLVGSTQIKDVHEDDE